jgi:hypothetical protein
VAVAVKRPGSPNSILPRLPSKRVFFSGGFIELVAYISLYT